MSKTADALGSKLARPESEEDEAAARVGGFGAVPPRRAAPVPAELLAGLPTGGETTQYQVPLELLVLARNKEKDKARSVAVTPVAPRPGSDQPPPSGELEALRIEPAAAAERAAPALSARVPAPPRLPSHISQLPDVAEAPLARAESAGAERSSSVARLSWLLLAALCAGAGYCAVELLRWL